MKYSTQYNTNSQTNPIMQSNNENRVEMGANNYIQSNKTKIFYALFLSFVFIYLFGLIEFFFLISKGFGHGNRYQTPFFQLFTNHFITNQGISYMNKSTWIASPLGQTKLPKDLNTPSWLPIKILRSEALSNLGLRVRYTFNQALYGVLIN